jgi:hypothetical protein
MCRRPDLSGAASFCPQLGMSVHHGASDDFAKQKCTLGSRWPSINTRYAWSSLHGEVAHEGS